MMDKVTPVELDGLTYHKSIGLFHSTKLISTILPKASEHNKMHQYTYSVPFYGTGAIYIEGGLNTTFLSSMPRNTQPSGEYQNLRNETLYASDLISRHWRRLTLRTWGGFVGAQAN